MINGMHHYSHDNILVPTNLYLLTTLCFVTTLYLVMSKSSLGKNLSHNYVTFGLNQQLVQLLCFCQHDVAKQKNNPSYNRPIKNQICFSKTSICEHVKADVIILTSCPLHECGTDKSISQNVQLFL